MLHRSKKIGRLQRLIRRMLIESDGWPIHVHDVRARAYVGQPPSHNQYRALWRARRKFAVQLRRGVLGPTRELERWIRDE